MTDSPRRYLFNPLERRGVLLGLQWVQLVALGTGLLGALAVLRAAPAPIGRLLAAVVALVAVGTAVIPRAGQPLAAWLPAAVALAGSFGPSDQEEPGSLGGRASSAEDGVGGPPVAIRWFGAEPIGLANPVGRPDPTGGRSPLGSGRMEFD